MDRFDLDTTELRARGTWHEVKGKIRKEYGNLTDDDLEYEEGQEEEWTGRLARKIGKSAADVKTWLQGLVN